MNSRVLSMMLIALAACSQFKQFEEDADASAPADAQSSDDSPAADAGAVDAGTDTAAAADAGDHCAASCGIGAVCDADGGCDHIADISSVYQHTCVLRSGGRAFCWGLNNDRQLGTQGPGLPVVNVDDATEVATGNYFSCFRRATSHVSCTGDLPGFEAVTDATSIASGAFHACVIRTSGEVACWGDNLYGQLGDGTMGNTRHAPVAVMGLVDADMIALGWSVSCARRRSGEVLCWGNAYLGAGASAHVISTPTPVAGVTDVQGLSLGRQHVCVLHSDGTVDCWGSNSNGQLGTGPALASSTTPVRLPGVTDAVEVSCGGLHTCVRTRSGQVLCAGSNNTGQLGDGTNVDRSTLVPVPGVVGAIRVTAADDHTCALLESGQALCWGANQYGQLGDGRTIDSATPVRVIGLP